VTAGTITVPLCRDEPLTDEQLAALIGQPIATPQGIEVGTVCSACNFPGGVEMTVLLHPAIQASWTTPLVTREKPRTIGP